MKLQTRDKYDVQVQYEPFLLRPQMPQEGIKKPPETPDNPRFVQNLHGY